MMDHHGITSHIIGNVLYTHCSSDRDCDVLPGDTLEDRLSLLNEYIRAFFYIHSRVANRLPPLRASNLKADDFPELKGNGVKAANTRSLVPYLVDLQHRAASLNPNDKNKMMRKLVVELQVAYNIMYEGASILGADECRALAKATTRIGQCYQWLSLQAFRSGICRWKSIPKLHYVAGQLAAQATLINPKFVQGYSSESMVGEICGIYQQSQSGPFRAVIQKTALLKYRTGFQLLWV